MKHFLSQTHFWVWGHTDQTRWTEKFKPTITACNCLITKAVFRLLGRFYTHLNKNLNGWKLVALFLVLYLLPHQPDSARYISMSPLQAVSSFPPGKCSRGTSPLTLGDVTQGQKWSSGSQVTRALPSHYLHSAGTAPFLQGCLICAKEKAQQLRVLCCQAWWHYRLFSAPYTQG